MAEDKDKNGEIIFFDKSIILDLTLKHIKIPLYHPSFFLQGVTWLDFPPSGADLVCQLFSFCNYPCTCRDAISDSSSDLGLPINSF